MSDEDKMQLPVVDMEERAVLKSSGGPLSDEETLAMDRRIRFKLDCRLIPVLALLFLCSFLDRTNVGNVKILGLVKDLGMSDFQYDKGLTVYYATYIASELPSNLVLKKVSPSIWLPFLTVAWGIVTMCLGFVRNYAGFVAVRAILGFTEGGLLPGIVLYLSGMYTRGELAFRIGLFYTSASLSGAFGGLLARGLNAIGTAGGLNGWRWVFIVEGLLTVVCGLIAYLFLPNDLESIKFFTEEEREYAISRLHKGENRHEPFAWSEIKRGVFNIPVYLSSFAYFGILTGLYSFGLFLPTIISELGGYTPNEVQLWSVIPYAVAAAVTVAISILSDRLKLRGVILLFALIPAIVGYAVIANIGKQYAHVKYGMTFLMAAGLYSGVPCVLTWNSNNSAGHYKRATTSALQLAIANSGGFVATFIYPTAQRPQFHKGHTVVLGLLVFAWFMVAFNVLYCAKVNRDKAQGKYEEYRGCGDDRDPEFKYVL